MVGIKRFNKGFYKDLILMWLNFNKDNKPLLLSEIRRSLKDIYNIEYIQPKIYKTLMFMKENNLAKYNNLKWKLNLKEIELYYLTEKNQLQNKLNQLKIDLENEIKSLEIVINKINKIKK